MRQHHRSSGQFIDIAGMYILYLTIWIEKTICRGRQVHKFIYTVTLGQTVEKLRGSWEKLFRGTFLFPAALSRLFNS